MRPMRGLIASLNSSGKYAYKASVDATSNHSSVSKIRVDDRPRRWLWIFWLLEEVNNRPWQIYEVTDFVGVVGLAIAQRLSARYPAKTTFLVERHSRPGEEIR